MVAIGRFRRLIDSFLDRPLVRRFVPPQLRFANIAVRHRISVTLGHSETGLRHIDPNPD